MDEIAKIFLSAEDYRKVRYALDEHMRQNKLDPRETDFLTSKPADKSFAVNLFPISESFEYAEPGDYAGVPEHEKPKTLTPTELRNAMQNSLNRLIKGD